MKTICMINLKGGVAKTISAINFAYILAVIHNNRVLLVDNDKQGNTSKFFGVHSYEDFSISDILVKKDFDMKRVVQYTKYKNLHVLPSNMNLLRANKEILLDVSRPQQTRLKKALDQVKNRYDFVVIDNAPDLNMSDINALVATDHVLIPIKVDKFAFDGLGQLIEQIEEVQEFNSSISIVGGFITMYSKNNVNTSGYKYLCNSNIPMLKTHIRKTVKVDETTFKGIPLVEYDKRATATKDYVQLVTEYLEIVEV